MFEFLWDARKFAPLLIFVKLELKELIFLPGLFFEARADIGEFCFVFFFGVIEDKKKNLLRIPDL